MPRLPDAGGVFESRGTPSLWQATRNVVFAVTEAMLFPVSTDVQAMHLERGTLANAVESDNRRNVGKGVVILDRSQPLV